MVSNISCTFKVKHCQYTYILKIFLLFSLEETPEVQNQWHDSNLVISQAHCVLLQHEVWEQEEAVKQLSDVLSV